MLMFAATVTACSSVPSGPAPPQAALSFSAVPLCYDYGCRTRARFSVSPSDRKALEELFKPALESPFEERQRIRLAIAILETVAGEQTPAHRDRGRNPWNSNSPGRMDCVDESINATVFLRLLEQHGLLRWHRVQSRAFRSPLLLDQHFAAQITDSETGERYVVDSWHLDNGRPPYIQGLEDWLRKRSFEPSLNPAVSVQAVQRARGIK